MWKNWITAFKVKVTVKVQNVNECLSGQYILNQPVMTKLDASSWVRVSCKVKVTVKAYIINMTVFTVLAELWILLQPK